MVSFNQISADLRTPGVFMEFDNSRANQGLSARPNKILLKGQRLSAGTVQALVPTLITNKDEGYGFFGPGSYLAAMCNAAKIANPNTEMYAIALDDEVGGAAAAGALAITGPATANGNIFLYIGGVRVVCSVANADAATAIATALAAAINANARLPVTAAAVGANVTVTARHKGTIANGINMRLNMQRGETLAAGIGCTITQLTGGTTDPSIAAAIAALGDVQYTSIATAFADAPNLAALEAELARRWGPDGQIEGQAFAATHGSVGTMSSFGNARNSPHSTVMAAGKSPTPAYLWAAVTAAVNASESDPARPRQTLPLPGIVAPIVTEQLTRSERNVLLSDGLSTYTVGPDGTVQIEKLVTTYQVNAMGLPDASYMNLTTPLTVAALRYDVRARIAQKFPRHKLADDGTRFGEGQAIVTPSILRGEIYDLFDLWEEAGLVEDWEQFKADLIVERSKTNPNRVDMRMGPNLVNQFEIFAGQIQFLV